MIKIIAGIIAGIPLIILTAIMAFILYGHLTILKTAVRESELAGKSYILAQPEKVTGFDWIRIKDESGNGNETEEYCNIIGTNPFELYLSYDFEISDNTYIFYITEERRYYSEKMREDMLDYVATGWDILYPVKRDAYLDLGLFSPSKYITKYDTWEYDIWKYIRPVLAYVWNISK